MLAVPGPVTSAMSAGCHEELRVEGTALADSVARVIEAVGRIGVDLAPVARAEEIPHDRLTPLQAQVLDGVRPRKVLTAEAIAAVVGVSTRDARRTCPVSNNWGSSPPRTPATGLLARTTPTRRTSGPGLEWRLDFGLSRPHGQHDGSQTSITPNPALPPQAPPCRPRCATPSTRSPATCAERNRSEHTVRAYVGDLVSLLDHAARMGIADPAGLTISVLRSWLGRLRTTGAARIVAGPARGGGAHLHRVGSSRRPSSTATSEPGLSSPKPHRDLPQVLRVDQAAGIGDGADRAPDQRRMCWCCATASCSSCCTRAECASPSCAASTSTPSTGSVASSACWARARRSGPSPSERRREVALNTWLAIRPATTGHERHRSGVAARCPGWAAEPDHGPAHRVRAWSRSGRPVRTRRRTPAAQRGDPPPRRRSGSAVGAGTARSRVAGEHADLHARIARSGCAARTTRPIPARDRRRLTRRLLTRCAPDPATSARRVGCGVAGTTIEGVEVSWTGGGSCSHSTRASPISTMDPSVRYRSRCSAHNSALRDEMEANPMAFFSRGLLDRLAHTRRHLAGVRRRRPGRRGAWFPTPPRR